MHLLPAWAYPSTLNHRRIGPIGSDGQNMPAITDAIKKIRSNQGAQIAYVEGGTGPDLLLIHGMFGDHLDWSPVLEPLTRRFHVVALDLPGFGDSDKPDTDYSADFFVSTLHDVAHHLNLKQPTLVGNSFGGQIAALYTLRYPDDVSRLVLVDSGGFREVPEAERQMARTMLSQENLRAMPAAMIPLLFSKVFAKDSPEKEKYLAKQAAKLSRQDYADYVRAITRSIDLSMATNLLEDLSRIACPCLVVSGEKDEVVPLAQSREAARRLPRATLHVVKGAGHVPQLEAPEEFVAQVEAFALDLFL
jgi:pimeloyl-ACP methyl ester carboxylesterase